MHVLPSDSPCTCCISDRPYRENGKYSSSDCFASFTSQGNCPSIEDKLEPIAIIGFDLKFPGDATSPEKFFQILMDGKSARSEIPEDRLNVDAFYQPARHKSGQFNLRGGHFIQEDIAGFDAPFFSITPSEAACMDPMQRGLLEATYKALENGKQWPSTGIPMEQIAGSNTGVYVGSITRDYDQILSRDMQMNNKHRSTGNSAALLANRLSWFYNLTGPSIALDTACSSSMYALHLACQSLRSGESSMSIVGGCNLCFDPDPFVVLADMNFLSPTSTCHSFDHRANGYARGEGFAIMIVKPLRKALEDGDTIRAVIRATGVGQDGRTPGITQPSSCAQEHMIRETYLSGGLDMKKTWYVEAHGTGTAVGDPLEAIAIGSAFAHEARTWPLYVGAVKTNIGHLEGASGIAGLLKTVLILEKGLIPPNIWFQRLNPKIPAEELNIQFPLKPMLWPTSGLRRASVNSFGFGGANAHVIIDDAFNYMKLRKIHGRHNTVDLAQTDENGGMGNLTITKHTRSNGQMCDPAKRKQLFVWSSSEEAGLNRLAHVYLDQIEAMSTSDTSPNYLESLAWTLSEKRSRLPWKAFVLADSITQLQEALGKRFVVSLRSHQVPRLAFCFTGQGAQWYAMGRELLQVPSFKQSLEHAERFFQVLGCSWLLIDELLKNEEQTRLGQAAYSQPICTALQIALVDMLYSWGVKPAIVIGHSSGEIAAAYSAGGLSRDSAWKVAYYRGVHTTSLAELKSGAGSMMSVGLSASAIQPYIHRLDTSSGQLSVACFNSPTNITLSGSTERIITLQSLLKEDDVFTRRLKVDVAYHSPLISEIAPAYLSSIRGISEGTPGVEYPMMFSSVTGSQITTSELSEGAYWVKNLVSPVKFHQALLNISSVQPKKLEAVVNGAQANHQIHHILEIGPHAALQGPIREILKSTSKTKKITHGSVLTRGTSAIDSTLEAMGFLYCLGYSLDIAAVNGFSKLDSHPHMLVGLPAYPFDHTKKYWSESRVSVNHRFRKHAHHSLLGTPVPDWNPLNARWKNIIRLEENKWVADHVVNDTIIYPAAGFLCMALEATRQLLDPTTTPIAYFFRRVSISKALVIPTGSEGVETQLHLQRTEATSQAFLTWSGFQIYAYENGAWSESCRGEIAVECQKHVRDIAQELERSKHFQQVGQNFRNGINQCCDPMTTERLYSSLLKDGLAFGPCFQTLSQVQTNDTGEAAASLNLHHWISETSQAPSEPYVIHPTSLDAIFQLGLPALSSGGRKRIPTIVPTQFDELSIYIGKGQLSALQTEATPQPEWLSAYAKSTPWGLRNIHSSFIAMSRESSEPCIVGSCQCTAVSDVETMASAQSEERRLCSLFGWSPDLDMMNGDSIREHCNSKACAQDRASSEAFRNHHQDLDRLCIQVLQRLDLTGISDCFPKDRLHLHRYLDWMKMNLARYHDEYIDMQRQNLSEEELASFYQMIEDTSIEGRLVARTARNLEKVLNGETDILELIFHDGLIDEYYASLHHSSEAFDSATRYIDAFASKNPNCKVLEIGAGTGGATKKILDVLMRTDGTDSIAPRFAEYAFTDISARFLEIARAKFGENGSRMVFRTLDIEKDPLEQGFVPEQYDVIVASSVLHATSKLEVTLRHTRKLLKPGGKLILIETTAAQGVSQGFIFGLLPGWWLGTEEYRKWGPLVHRKEWHDLLAATQFSGIEIAFPPDEKDEGAFSTLVSTALQAPQCTPTIPNIKIICQTDSAAQLDLAKQLMITIEKAMPSRCEILDIDHLASATLKDTTCVFLPEIERPVLYELSETAFPKIQHLLLNVDRLIWITGATGSESEHTRGMITGLRRSIYMEVPDKIIVSLALQELGGMGFTISHILKVLRSVLVADPGDYEPEYREIDGRLCVNRLIPAKDLDRQVTKATTQQRPELTSIGQQSLRRLKVSMSSPGMLDTFRLEDDEPPQPLASNHIEIKVVAAGLNFRDVLVALGRGVGENSHKLGAECSGVITQVGKDANFRVGDRVACLYEGSMATYVRCKASLAVKIPDHMTFQSAAGFPVVFATAYHCIVQVGRLGEGESILIHSAAGGLGQACIQLAKLFKAEIFATVGDDDKKNYLVEYYGIQADHIFSSRNSAFASGVKRLTCGRGIDVIINSLADEALRCTWDCIAPFGRFLETGKKDVFSAENLPMFPFSKGASFAGVNILYDDNGRDVIGGLLKASMELLIEGKIFVPTPLQIYEISEIEKAFRHLQSGKNIGKVVIAFDDEAVVPIIPSKISRYDFDPNATYVIAGGLGGLGRSIASWMVSRNAKHLILLSRKTTYNEGIQNFLSQLQANGIKVATPPCDIGDRRAVAAALATCSTMPPVKGCIQSAMVLRDKRFATMTYEDFQVAVKPKVQGSWNLHEILPKGLDFFILLASCSGIVGLMGQSNYASGNTYQDALARHRVALGDKAVSIDLCGVLDVGYVAEQQEVQRFSEISGCLNIEENELHALLDHYCDPTLPILDASHCQVVIGLENPNSRQARSTQSSWWRDRPLFRALHQKGTQAGNLEKDPKVTVDYRALISGAATLADVADIIIDGLQTKLSNTLAVDKGDIDISRPIHTYGVDSLSAVELRLWFKNVVGADVAVFEILGNVSIAALGTTVARKSQFVAASLREDNVD